VGAACAATEASCSLLRAFFGPPGGRRSQRGRKMCICYVDRHGDALPLQRDRLRRVFSVSYHHSHWDSLFYVICEETNEARASLSSYLPHKRTVLHASSAGYLSLFIFFMASPNAGRPGRDSNTADPSIFQCWNVPARAFRQGARIFQAGLSRQIFSAGERH